MHLPQDALSPNHSHNKLLIELRPVIMMAKASINSCPVCNGNHWTHVCTCAATEEERCEVLLCTDCGLVKRMPVPQNDDTGIHAIDKALRTPPKSGIISRCYDLILHTWNRQKAHITEREAGRVSGVLLDAGCHRGNFITTMRQRGWIAHGIERNNEARQYGNTHYNLRIEKGEMLYRIHPKSYNVVTAWDFIGQTQEPRKGFKALCDLLTSDGTLIVGLYNPASDIATRHKEIWYRLMAHDTYLFSRNAFERLAADNNMQIIRVQNSTAMTMAANTACQLLRNKYRKQITALARGCVEGFKTTSARRYKPDNGCYIIYTLKHKTLPQ